MNWAGIPLLTLLFALPSQAQQPCPSGGMTKSGSSGQTITWTSYVVKTGEGVCLERRVHTQGRMYVNWPAAEMSRVYVDHDYTTTRRGFSESTLTDADLEYGVLGQKLKTTVYQGFRELAAKTAVGVDGQLQVGSQILPVGFSALSVPAVRLCDKPNGSDDAHCRNRYQFVFDNIKSPLVLKWSDAMSPQFDVPLKSDGKVSKEFLMAPGKGIKFAFDADVVNAPGAKLSIETKDGQVLAVVPGAKP
jgi:hypothetical protein